MPKITEHTSLGAVKMLLLGDSGTRKTGALFALAKAGYTLGIVDYDNGCDILAQLARREPDKTVGARINYETFTDRLKSINGNVIPVGQPKAWVDGTRLLDKWPDLGPVCEWDASRVLVIDSLTMASLAAYRFTLSLTGRSTLNAQIQDWGEAMKRVEELLALLYSDYIQCNVVITSHITSVEAEDGTIRRYPNAIGSKLPPKIGRYFNTVLLSKTQGSGKAKQTILTASSEGGLELKSAVMDFTPVPTETGLAEYFKQAIGAPPGASPQKSVRAGL